MSLKAAARGYYKQGLPIIAVKHKKPLCTWEKWQTEPQSLEEFENQSWDQAEGFAVLCGSQAHNSLFFVAIDVDSENFDPKLLPCTQLESTPRGGYHFIFWSRQNCRGRKDHALKVELLGKGNLCIMTPSEGYRKINDNLPSELEDIDLLFKDLIVKLGGQPTRELVDVQRLLKGVQVGERDNAAIRLATYYRMKGYSPEQVLNELLSWDQERNEIPLGASVIAQKVDSAFRMEKPYHFRFVDVEPKDAVIAALKYFDRNGFQPIIFAKDLLDEYNFKTTRDNETIFVYNPNTGVYTPTGETVIKEEMQSRLGEDLRKRFYGDVEFKIQASTYFERPKNPSNKIALFNGILNLNSFELEPFSPEEFITIQVPLTYEPSQDCPKIKRFFAEIVGPEQLPLIQEFFGYCIHQAYPIHKALMLVGRGANGKSTLINLLKRFLGNDNVSNVSLQALCENRFAPATLYGKLANLYADLPDKALTRTGMFKMLTGGDTIGAEEKFKDFFSFVNFAKLIFSTNKIPETFDDTIAFFRRWLILECKNMFVGNKKDPAILEKITTPSEMSGLLNWALEGLKRLLEQGDFTHTPSIEQAKTEYIRKSNTAKAYVEENLEPAYDAQARIIQRELYQAYVVWCQKNQLEQKNKGEFTKVLYQTLPNVRPSQMRYEGGRVDVYQYVQFRTGVSGVSTCLSPLKKTEQKELDSEVLTVLTPYDEEASE